MKRLSLLFCMGLILLTLNARAEVVEFKYGDIYSGDYSTFNNTAPWFSSRFEDTGTPNTVKLTIDAYNLYEEETIDKMYFNVDYTGTLNFTRVGGSAPSTTGLPKETPAFNLDSYKAGPVGDFDIFLNFLQGSGDRFTDEKTAVFNITGTGLTARMFDSFSTDGRYKTAAHLMGDEDGSAWVGNVVPEPLSAALFLMGGAGLALARRKKKL